MNPWDKVQTTYTAYIDAVCKEQLAQISCMSARRHDRKGDLYAAKKKAWDAARHHKSMAYVDHVRVVDTALESGIPCPW